MSKEKTRVDITLANGETTTYTKYGYYENVLDDIIRDIGESGCVVFDFGSADKQSTIFNFAHVSSIRLYGYQVK